jgi:hypothetical protein
MEVSKVPQADSSAGSATAVQTSTSTDIESSTAAAVISAIDFADIRPLDVAAALQILVAEVRAGLDASLEGSLAPNAARQNPGAQQPIAQTPMPLSPVQAAHELLDMLLRAMPEDASDASAWTVTLIAVETAVQSSLERAVSVVASWRDTPQPIVDAAKQTRALFLEAMGDEAENPLWLRPEWMGLGAPFPRFRRRRRNVRRRLADPDYPVGNLDDESEEIR